MNLLTKQIQNVFPVSRTEALEIIAEIQAQLCPTCHENEDIGVEFDLTISGGDCKKRPKYISAAAIYDGVYDDGKKATDNLTDEQRAELLEGAQGHWLGALIDARGAFKMIGQITGVTPYYAAFNRQAFTAGCKAAQCFMLPGDGWNSASRYAQLLAIGAAYKFGDPADPLYDDMTRFGGEE